MSADPDPAGPDTQWLSPAELRREVEAPSEPAHGRHRKAPEPDSEGDTIARIIGASLAVAGTVVTLYVAMMVAAAVTWGR